MSKISTAGNNIQNRTDEEKIEGDRFHTPASLAERLVQCVPQMGRKESWLDPCKGFGAFYDAFPDDAATTHHWCEIEQGRDFFKLKDEHDWIVSNPPFSQLTDWIKHTLRLSRIGFAYILPLYSISHSRLELIELAGFKCVDIVLFKNPVSWKIGFQFAFFVFIRTEQLLPDESASIRRLNDDGTLQSNLNQF